MAHAMTQYERDIMFQVAGKCDKCFPMISQICLLPYRRKGEFFRYCIAKGITGENFAEYAHECGNSPSRFYSRVIKKIDGLMARPMIKRDLQ